MIIMPSTRTAAPATASHRVQWKSLMSIDLLGEAMEEEGNVVVG